MRLPADHPSISPYAIFPYAPNRTPILTLTPPSCYNSKFRVQPMPTLREFLQQQGYLLRLMHAFYPPAKE